MIDISKLIKGKHYKFFYNDNIIYGTFIEYYQAEHTVLISNPSMDSSSLIKDKGEIITLFIDSIKNYEQQ